MILIEDAYSYAGTENICNFMSSTLTNHHKVIVCSLKGRGKPFYPFKNVELISLEENGVGLWSLFKIINKKNITHVFVISMGKLSVIFYLLRLFLGGKSVSVNKKYIACEHVSISSFPYFKRRLKLWALKSYDKVISLTYKDKKILDEYDINSFVIKNPIDHHMFHRKTRTYNVLSVGRLSHQKGYDILLPIWKKFLDRCEVDKYTLNIAGAGEDFEKIANLIDKLSLNGKVVLLGKVDNIDEYYKNSDFLLMSSRYEGLPMALLEAKSWSLPVISFDCPTGPKEIITHDVDGYLVPMYDDDTYVDGIISLATDDDKYFKMSKNTFKTSLEFSSANIKEQWLRIIDEDEIL